jgi:hypothetical protein
MVYGRGWYVAMLAHEVDGHSQAFYRVHRKSLRRHAADLYAYGGVCHYLSVIYVRMKLFCNHSESIDIRE